MTGPCGSGGVAVGVMASAHAKSLKTVKSRTAAMFRCCDGGNGQERVWDTARRGRFVSLMLAACVAFAGLGASADNRSAGAVEGVGGGGRAGDGGVAAGVGWLRSAAVEGAVDRFGAAPVWPFRGIVAHGVVDGDNVLEYWSSETGEVSRVRLGPVHLCILPLAASGELVAASAWGIDGTWVRYRVPWGDFAYPVVGGFRNRADGAEVLGRLSLFRGRLDVVPVEDVMRVATPRGEAFYRTWSDLGIGLEAVDAPAGNLSDHELQEAEMWWPGFGPIGSDGFYYGIGAFWNEPACPAEDGFVVAGDTGEVVACSSGVGAALSGAAFVVPEGSQESLETFALPQPIAMGECASFDLERLRPRVSVGAPE